MRLGRLERRLPSARHHPCGWAAPAPASCPVSLSRSEAVRLFVDRARSARADIVLDDDQLRAIAEICRRVDGLPLAIELAAARVRLLQPVELLRRLGSRLAVLTGGSRDLPERQRTLRRTVEWSHDLLEDDDKLSFARLAVFVGGFSLRAAQEVCADERVPDVLSGLASLVDKSLLRVNPAVSGEPRFAMLDSVREFALERLEASGEADLVRERHARFFLEFAAGIDPAKRGALDPATLDQYVTDSGNLGAAMRTFLDRGATDEAAGLGRSLWQFWWVHALFEPGIGWMEELLAGGPRLTEAVRAQASFVLGMLSFEKGEEDRALPALRTAVALHSKLGDRRSASLAAIPLGLLEARSDPAGGERLLHGAVRDFRELGDPWGLAFALLSLGGAKLFRDLPDEAVPLLEESVALARTAGTAVFFGNALVNLGLAHTARGDFDAAHRVLGEALERSRVMQTRETTARALDGLAAVAVATGEPERATRLAGAAEGIRRSLGADVFPPDRISWARTRALLDERLGPTARAERITSEAHRPVAELLAERW